MEKPISDELRLGWMERNRVAVIPEMQGGWSAEVYGDEDSPSEVAHGSSPREALDKLIAAFRMRVAP